LVRGGDLAALIRESRLIASTGGIASSRGG
jgi:hypothetical protein